MPSNPHPAKVLKDQCSIARAVKLIGDDWTLLILRELFWGQTRYDLIAQYTGIASNILAARLRLLVKNGIVTKTVDEQDARRFDYKLTQKGVELFPVLMTIMQWGDQWSAGDHGPLIELTHLTCGKRTKPGLVCTSCGEPLNSAQVKTRIAKPYRPVVEQYRQQQLAKADALQ